MTEALQQLSQVDLFSFLIILFLIITIFVSAATLIGKASEIIGKPVKWVKKRNNDHEDE